MEPCLDRHQNVAVSDTPSSEMGRVRARTNPRAPSQVSRT
ncbi:hypothetical protein Ga0080574_TMP693 [Salipiger abyssi]|uniref:Uncharacterized protein n=1 Tax=Salipiger abyssi TaxID=1250539 RepID=A0A1P8UNU3_9RHOB|nr:hypothetical protein Ga0080574_TMP693 [Salipiger abyssi]